MTDETKQQVRVRQAREYHERMEALCKTLGPDSLAGLPSRTRPCSLLGVVHPE